MNSSIKDTLNSSVNPADLFYDWFCRDSYLPAKGKKLLQKLSTIANSARFDADKTYVFFKNNLPMQGKGFDDFRICDLETGDVIYTVVPASGFDKYKGKALVYGAENDFEEPLVIGTWADVKRFFLNA